jgi:hypothetical protein
MWSFHVHYLNYDFDDEIDALFDIIDWLGKGVIGFFLLDIIYKFNLAFF